MSVTLHNRTNVETLKIDLILDIVKQKPVVIIILNRMLQEGNKLVCKPTMTPVRPSDCVSVKP
jgi:hypothetical protein